MSNLIASCVISFFGMVVCFVVGACAYADSHMAMAWLAWLATTFHLVCLVINVCAYDNARMSEW